MDTQRVARTTGVLFIVTIVASVPALLLYGPILKDDGFATYVAGAGADRQIYLAAFLELITIAANIATAIVLVPVLKRQSETLTLGYVAARMVECGFIAVGILSMLAVVTLRQDAGADSAGVAQALVAVKDYTFLLGPGFTCGIGNGMILGYLVYKSGLIPKRLALFGLVGGPLVCLSGILVLFDVFELGGFGQGLFTIPEIVWEGAVLGIYLTVKGFAPTSTIRSGVTPATTAAA
jgi:hypothetical protein